MKRLKRNADYYNEYDDANKEDNISRQLFQCAEEYCSRFGINQSTISVEISGTSANVVFGSIEEEGYEVSIDIYDVYSNKGINRIIMSAGKNSKGKSIYVETREQSILDSFLKRDSEFENWMQSSIENIEDRF